jgi:hypothetical protein
VEKEKLRDEKKTLECYLIYNLIKYHRRKFEDLRSGTSDLV